METAQIDRIRIYPIKALDHVEVEEATIGMHSLLNDRIFAMTAADGRYVNGKRTGRVNELKASYDLANRTITLSERTGSTSQCFDLNENNRDLIDYLSDFFGIGIMLLASEKGELMDVPTKSSVTILSEASIASLQDNLPQHSLEDLRLRFRANIELKGVEAFREEQLFQEPGTGVRFLAGDVEMIGISPRARCNVPPRNPLTGETNKQFVKLMMESRAKSLPANSMLTKHGNLYHLSVDTYVPASEKGKTLRKGDPIKIIGPVNLS